MVLSFRPFEETDFGKEFWQMFWVSLILHLAVIFFVAFSRKILPPPIYYAPPSLTTVDLVTMEKPKPVKKAVPIAKKTVPAKPKPKPEKKIPIPKAKAEPKKEVKPAPPEKKEPPAKEYSDKEINSRIANLKKKVQQQRTAEQQAIAARGKITSRLMEIKYKSYYDTIWIIIASNYEIPEGATVQSGLEVIVGCKITKQGRITDIVFEKRSGNDAFDNSVIRSLEKSSPLPQLPGDEQIMEFGMRFSPSGLQQ